MRRVRSAASGTGRPGQHPTAASRASASCALHIPHIRRYATQADTKPSAAAPAESASPPLAEAHVPRGPTPRRGRIKFTPEAMEKIHRAHLLRETHKFWKRHFEEQRRAEAEQLVKYKTELKEERVTRRQIRNALRGDVSKEAAEAAAQLRADRERLKRSAAQMFAVEEKIRAEAKKEWLMALNEDADMWDKTPDELKNRRFVERRDLIYYTGRN